MIGKCVTKYFPLLNVDFVTYYCIFIINKNTHVYTKHRIHYIPSRFHLPHNGIREVQLGTGGFSGAIYGGAILGMGGFTGVAVGGKSLGTGNFAGADDGGKGLGSCNFAGADVGEVSFGIGDFTGVDVGDIVFGTGNFAGANVGDETLGTGDFTSANDVGDETLGSGVNFVLPYQRRKNSYYSKDNTCLVLVGKRNFIFCYTLVIVIREEMEVILIESFLLENAVRSYSCHELFLEIFTV